MTVMSAEKSSKAELDLTKPIQQLRKRYARLSSRSLILHKRGEVAHGFDATNWTMCGRYVELGSEATPLMIGEEERVCKACIRASY